MNLPMQRTTTGQEQARTRWGTGKSGAAFDRKKQPYLTEEAQLFLAEQTNVVLTGQNMDGFLSGLLVTGQPGVLRVVNSQTCLLPIGRYLLASPLFQGIAQAQARGQLASVALCALCHATRRRLSIQGVAEIMPGSSLLSDSLSQEQAWLSIQVTQSFFHCPKYIHTDTAELARAATVPRLRLSELPGQTLYSSAFQEYLGQQLLGYLCTVDREGRCAVNHRGGSAGFLITLPPTEQAPYGRVLLPDYTGNGAFEAIGNILETRTATLFIPGATANDLFGFIVYPIPHKKQEGWYSFFEQDPVNGYNNGPIDRLALSIGGSAQVYDIAELPVDLQRHCSGAERVILLAVQYLEGQIGY